MRAHIQRVTQASVSIDNQVVGSIEKGFLILLGIETADTGEDINWLVQKISQMRIFADEEGKMNKSLLDIEGEALVVSQFTLHASTKKGNRPSFIRAARPEQSKPLYEAFIKALSEKLEKPCATGEFGAEMAISLTNDGPVTLLIDSKNKE